MGAAAPVMMQPGFVSGPRWLIMCGQCLEFQTSQQKSLHPLEMHKLKLGSECCRFKT